MKQKKKRMMRVVSLLLCCVVMFSSSNITAFGEKVQIEDNRMCTVHPEHTPECGYQDSGKCSHQHGKDCNWEITNCVHTHTEECYPDDEAVNLEKTEDTKSEQFQPDEDDNALGDTSEQGSTENANSGKAAGTESTKDTKSEQSQPDEDDNALGDTSKKGSAENVKSDEVAGTQSTEDTKSEQSQPDEDDNALGDTSKKGSAENVNPDQDTGRESTDDTNTGTDGERLPSACTHTCTVESGCVTLTPVMPPDAVENSVVSWTWVDEDELLIEQDGEWYLGLPGATPETITEKDVKALLPENIKVTLTDGTKEEFPLTWDLSELLKPTDLAEPTNSAESAVLTQSTESAESTESIESTEPADAAQSSGIEVENADNEEYNVYELYAMAPEDSPMADQKLTVHLILGGAQVYASYPGNRRILSEEQLNEALQTHQVQGITPEGVTVNLFDYVASKDGVKQNDITNKTMTVNTITTGSGAGQVAKSTEWNLGINKNRLLLFGDSMIGAGYWNLGAGAGRKWARDNTNMKGIVEPILKNGYPTIDLEAAVKPIATNGKNYGSFDIPAFMDWAADESNQASNVTEALNAPGLSEAVLKNCGNPSLAYLFNPKEDLGDNAKRSYENVTGLFQVNEDGYYYYDARENFAEFKKAEGAVTSRDGRPSDGSFTLYDGSAVWRTDGGWDGTGFNGDYSLGNFYPFNTGRQVFDSIDTGKGCLSSSENLDSRKWSGASNGLTNDATKESVFINHHMGMTMTVDFAQPTNGQLNMGTDGKKNMVFQFSGDDDVWIFVDDVLVLDLGGIHSELYGTIDFSTGKIVTGQSWRYGGLPDNPGSNEGDTTTTLYDAFVTALGQESADVLGWVEKDGAKIFPTGSTHSLKLFYLERGNYDSSLQMRFNLQPSISHSIKKVDQNGDPLKDVKFQLYKAQLKEGKKAPEDTMADVADFEISDTSPIGTLTTGEDGKAAFTKEDGSPFSFTDQLIADGTSYYILREMDTPDGYRKLPRDIVLRFDSDTSMLIVANRYQTGAYASFLSNIQETGKLTYGQFDKVEGNIAPSQITLSQNSKQNGLIIAVPMLKEEHSGGKWVGLYGSNTEGYGSVAPEERTAPAWRKAILKAALYQASDERWPAWHLVYNKDKGKLEGLLEDLPGRSDRYALNNSGGDMKMVYGILEPNALTTLGITGATSAERYDALEAYVSGKISNALKEPENQGKPRENVVEKVINGIVDKLSVDSDDFGERDFSFLNTDQFLRDFRSTIYIPNERRELRVRKVDENNNGVDGARFTLYHSDKDGTDGAEVVTGVTATVDGQKGALIFMPNPPKDNEGNVIPGYAQVAWTESDSYYTLQETEAPEGYELNNTKIPVILGHYSIYAGAGTADDGVTVMAGVGKLMQTMKKYAADDTVNITLRDITAIAQKQDSLNVNSLDKWQDVTLSGTTIPQSMDLHYGENAMVDYGLHDEDGGENTYPFFTTNVGFLRTRVVQNTKALRNDALFGVDKNTANWDDLGNMDLTSLFSQLNIVVVTDKKNTPDNTGMLRISKKIEATEGNNLTPDDRTKNFTFNISLKNADNMSLEGEYYYYGAQHAGKITDGETISLRGGEAVEIKGLPVGTRWEISEKQEVGWSVSTLTGTVISGQITKENETAEAVANADFVNYKGTPPTGSLEVSKTVDGDAGERSKEFHFIVKLNDKTLTGTYGEMNFTNGVAEFTLKHEQKILASGLPAGISYSVEETEANQDGYNTTTNNEEGEIEENKTISVEFTNTRGMGKLEVSKTVTGSDGDKNKEFKFTVELSDKTLTGTYGEMEFTNGVATFTLKHNESKTASGLPAGITYSVEETEANQDGYITIYTNKRGTIIADAIVSAKVTNKKDIIEIYKVDAADNNKKLKGAEFVFYYTKEAENGLEEKYYYHPEDKNWVLLGESQTEDAVKLTSDQNGKIIQIVNIANGNYYLKELKAPEGYKLLKQEIVITVEDGKITSSDGLEYSIDPTGKKLTVKNHAGDSLPDTGGQGTDWYTNCGLLLMGIALVYGYVMKHKRGRRNRA